MVVGGHVGEDDDFCAGRGGGDLDGPIFEDVEADAVGGALVHVGVVFAGPGEGLAC